MRGISSSHRPPSFSRPGAGRPAPRRTGGEAEDLVGKSHCAVDQIIGSCNPAELRNDEWSCESCPRRPERPGGEQLRAVSGERESMKWKWTCSSKSSFFRG